jgi:flagellar basal-body rod protein FlgB
MSDGPNIIHYLEAGLKGVGLRQATIANNIANLDTPGFRRSDVMFEKVLADAIEDNKLADLDENESWVFTPGTTPVGPNGNDVSLDVEVGELVKNGALYKTYIRLLGRMYRQLDLAIRDTTP